MMVNLESIYWSKGKGILFLLLGLKVIARAVIERFARFLEVKMRESALSGKPIR